MRAHARLVALGAVAFVAGAPLVACFDLFHSTSFETACAADAAACGLDAGAPPAASDAGDADAPFDAFDGNFCAWDESTAQAAALRSCAWLGACAGAIGDDVFGTCVFHATLAYDCTANPNRPVLGAAHDFWECLAKAMTCGDVEACVEPTGTRGTCQPSSTAFAGCEGSSNPDSFVVCGAEVNGSSPRLGVENCAELGQTCVTSGVAAVCAGASTGCSAPGLSCDSAGVLHDCDPDAGLFDFGVDCTSFGAGTCSSFGACNAVGSGTCEVASAVTCNGSVATGCPSGVPETLDCAALAGDAGLACDPNAPGRAWDVSRACSSGSCGSPVDSCSNGLLTSCARGAIVTADCYALGLGECTTVTYPGDAGSRAQCGAPVGD